MKNVCIFAAVFFAASAGAQQIGSVYNRDTGEQFTLKSVTTTSTVYGAIVKNRTVYTFDNPYKKLTEASVSFELNEGSVLDGFAYWYKDEYVKGILMDKAKAWFIYTAITSRDRDPGIMEQVSPSSYHAQIYPLAVGYPLRLELTTVEYLKPKDDVWQFPNKPEYAGAESQQFVNTANPYVQISAEGGKYEVHRPETSDPRVFTTAQRWRDGRVYVTGTVQTKGDVKPTWYNGLQDTYVVETGDDYVSFVGRLRGASSFTIKLSDGGQVRVPVQLVTEGDEAAKLWAHQALINEKWESRNEVLQFSMKYQVPSKFTALLAVPQEEMKLFRQKAAEYEKQMREEARRQREWQKKRNLNWDRSQGGDPEIRVSFVDCETAYAKLPDGRIINLAQTAPGVWGGNFEIPADAPEGEYIVKVYAMKRDGSVEEKDLKYFVDRTPPIGRVVTRSVLGIRLLLVQSEADLAKVTAFLSDGRMLELKQALPGIYVAAIPEDAVGEAVISLVDSAHNRGELRCPLR